MKNQAVVCNETRKITDPESQKTIFYSFVTEDGNTPSFAKVSLGDTDPVTGEVLSDFQLFQDYYLIRNREVEYNLYEVRRPLTKKEKLQRRVWREEIRVEFVRKHGYEPSKDDLNYLLEERCEDRTHFHYEAMAEKADGNCIDHLAEMADPRAGKAFEDVTGSDTALLQAFAARLTGRLADVYQMALQNESGGVKILEKDVAAKWHVSEVTIYKDRQKLFQMVREYFAKEA